MENNLERQCATKSSCKVNYKCIVTGMAILVLIISTSFLFLKYKEQMNVIDQQSSYVSKLEMENNDLSSYVGRNNNRSYVSTLFDDFWFFSDMPFDNIFDNFVSSFNKGADHIFTKQSVSHINYNTIEDKYEINVVTPGFKREDISIELLDNIIVIIANSKTDENNDGLINANNKRSSVVQSKVKQSIKIPRDANPEEITASLENGILSITVPRNKEAKSAKKIEIN